MRIFERFKLWFGIRGASRKLHKVDAKIDALSQRRVTSMAELENRQRELERLRDRMDADLDEARKIHMRMEFALEEATAIAQDAKALFSSERGNQPSLAYIQA